MRIAVIVLAVLTFGAAACGCAHTPKPLADYDAGSPADPFFFGVAAPLRDAPHGKANRESDCTSPLYVEERRGTSTLVRVGDRKGWIDDADLTSKPDRCTGPIYVSSARGASLRPPNLEMADRDGPGSLPKRFYRVREDDAGAKACVESKVESESIIEGFELSGSHDIVTWGLRAEDDGRSLTLTGPTVEKMDAQGNVDEKSRVHWLCLAQWNVVKHSGDAWMLVNGWGYTGRPSAFAPEAAMRWYTSKKACEKAIGPGPRAKAVSHHGCA